MSDRRFERMEDFVIANMRLALMKRPKHGTIGLLVTFHEGQIVRIETSKSEQFKPSAGPHEPTEN
jgi:hypothetical protein